MSKQKGLILKFETLLNFILESHEHFLEKLSQDNESFFPSIS